MIGAVTRAVDNVVGRVATKLASALAARIEPLVVEAVERQLAQRLGGVSVASCEAPGGPATDRMHGGADATSSDDARIDTLGTPRTLRSSGVVGVGGTAAGRSTP